MPRHDRQVNSFHAKGLRPALGLLATAKLNATPEPTAANIERFLAGQDRPTALVLFHAESEAGGKTQSQFSRADLDRSGLGRCDWRPSRWFFPKVSIKLSITPLHLDGAR